MFPDGTLSEHEKDVVRLHEGQLIHIEEEVNDIRYLDSMHGTVRTYNKGCRGLLCNKAERDRCADNKRRARNSTRVIVPSVEKLQGEMFLQLMTKYVQFHWEKKQERVRAIQQEPISLGVSA